MESLQIGSAVAKPGQRGNGYLKVASLNDGSPVNTPVIIFNGIKPGPRLWIHSGMHGDEITGALGMLQVFPKLNPQEMAGSLIALPSFNITGFWLEQRYSPFSYRDTVGDASFVFPGKIDGTFTEIMVYNIFQTFIKNADYGIDFHTGKHDDSRWLIYWEDGSETAKKSREFAQAFGIELIARFSPGLNLKEGRSSGYTEEGLQGFFITQATRHNIPSIMVECGGKFAYTSPQAVTTVAEGLVNVMKYLKILNGPLDVKDRRIRFLKDWLVVGMPHGGRFVPTVGIRDSIKKGQVIARIFTIFDEELEPVKSPMDGIVLTMSQLPFVYSGDYIFQIGSLE